MDISTLQDAINSRIRELVAEEADAAAERVRERIRKEADHIALSALKFYDVRRNGDTLVIEVRKDQQSQSQ